MGNLFPIPKDWLENQVNISNSGLIQDETTERYQIIDFIKEKGYCLQLKKISSENLKDISNTTVWILHKSGKNDIIAQSRDLTIDFLRVARACVFAELLVNG